MGDVFTRRCGCGAILALRESCGVCASRKRAELLHAAGFCRRESGGATPYDNGKPRLGKAPDGASLKLPSGRELSVTPARGKNVVLDEVTEYKPLSVTREQMEAALNARHMAKHNPCSHPVLRASQKNGDCPDCGGAVAWTYGSAFTICKDARKDKHEPPPVGAEVEWSVAERDMRARPEARYREFGVANDYVGEFATRFIGDVCWFGDPDVGWVDKNDDESRTGLRWRRLPDATTLPAIGEECDWATAKRDMQQRKEARYRGDGNLYAWSHGVLVCKTPHDPWCTSLLTEEECGEERWVRLA